MVGAKARLVGVRFHPTDEELVNHYLKRKLLKTADEEEEACVIPEINIYNHDPYGLNKVYNEVSHEKSDGSYCYFFCPRDKTRYTRRKTRDGFWKETSEKQMVQDEETMWTKRYFVYHQGPQRSSSKTDWVMHEYCIGSTTPEDETTSDNTSDKAAFSLCHIKRKKKKKEQRKSNTPASNGARQAGFLGQIVPDQQIGIPRDKEENISIQASIQSEISTNSEPIKQSVNDKPSEEQQSENNSVMNNYDTGYDDYIAIADLFNQKELDQELIRDALY